MDNDQWTAFGKASDEILDKERSKNKYDEHYIFTNSDLNHLWQLLRTAIKSAAKENIPNHKSYAQDKRFMPYVLSVIYNNIKKINKIYHKFLIAVSLPNCILLMKIGSNIKQTFKML